MSVGYDQRTRLRDFRQEGSLKLLFPRQAGDAMQAVSVNTAGGVTGGDRFALTAALGPRAHLSLTTQAAERAYRAKPGEIGRIDNMLRVADGARMCWLPQETILFDGCNLDRRLGVDLRGTARALIAETVIFGRRAMDETIGSGTFRDRVEIRRDGALCYLDQICLDGDFEQHLSRPFVAGHARALTTILVAAPNAEAHINEVRDALPKSGGASLLRDDLLVLRIIAEDSFALRQTMMPLLRLLTGAELPRPWMI